MGKLSGSGPITGAFAYKGGGSLRSPEQFTWC